jgi:hypothetical protein
MTPPHSLDLGGTKKRSIQALKSEILCKIILNIRICFEFRASDFGFSFGLSGLDNSKRLRIEVNESTSRQAWLEHGFSSATHGGQGRRRDISSSGF